MKKTLLAILATVAMVACSNNEIVREAAPEAIGFDNAFVNNSTRSVNDPSYSNTNLFKNFAVYGFVEDAVLFNGTKVAKDITNTELKQAWKYAGTQYWITGANYDFYAVAPFEGNWAIKTGTTPASDGAKISFTNVNGTQDLLYSGIVARQGVANNNAAVAFTFKHILSTVKFSFENGYNASAATICVRDIKITNAYETGVATLGANAAAWGDQAGVITDGVAFGNATTVEAYATDANEANLVNYDYAHGTTIESYFERFLIPGEATKLAGDVKEGYKVTFKVDLLVNGTKVKTYDHTAYANFVPVAGNAYNIKTTINASNIDPNHAQETIEFTVTTITDWDNDHDGKEGSTGTDDKDDQVDTEI